MQSQRNRQARFTIKVALHLRWLTTEKFQSYETVKGGCIPSKNKFETQKNIELRWLPSDINSKLLHTGCPITHDFLLKISFPKKNNLRLLLFFR